MDGSRLLCVSKDITFGLPFPRCISLELEVAVYKFPGITLKLYLNIKTIQNFFPALLIVMNLVVHLTY